MQGLLRRSIRRIANLAKALEEGNSLLVCWSVRRAGLFRLPILYGELEPGQSITVLDVGAGRGRSGQDALTVFPSATIHSFEPSKRDFEVLEQAAAASPNWRVYNCALGRESGVRHLLVFDRHPEASSFYRASKELSRSWPEYDFSVVHPEGVRVMKLSDFVADASIDSVDILKIDVQGAELEVLQGSEACLSEVKYLIIEMSFVSTYRGAPTFAECHRFLLDNGFHLRALANEYRDPGGRLIQADALYGGPAI